MNSDAFERLRLRHLQAFVTVCEEGHVGRAAARLHLTQPAVSKTLAELDAIAGVVLIDRGRRGAVPTPRGEAFLPEARAVLTALSHAAAVASGSTTENQPPVRLGVLPTVAPRVVPEALTRLFATDPHIRVAIETATNPALVRQLTSGTIDLVLGRMSDPAATPGLIFEWLLAAPLAMIVRADHPLLTAAAPPLSFVLACPLIVATPGTVPRQHTESFIRRQGATLPAPWVETLSVSVARLLVMRSNAVWFTTESAVVDDLEAGRLRVLGCGLDGTEEPVGLLRRRDVDLSPSTARVAAALRDAATAMR